MMRSAGLLLLLAIQILAQDSNPFESRIRPILATRCLRCHGGETVSSGFDMTTRESFAKGGAHGPAVVPGNARASRLYQWVEQGKMPLEGSKLDAAEVAAVRAWIDQGANWGAVTRLLDNASPSPSRDRQEAVQRQWWAFRAPAKPATPRIASVSNPIDAFILEKLRAKALDFAPRAGERTLLRRLSFDLTGLPPQPELNSLSYADAVERLLASPHYGERWARHWLDVVRFGETDGGEHNYERPAAWPYRDWVIDAFQRDKPYQDFIREQIAGDVIAPQDPKMVAATGFLVAGPWDQVSVELNKDNLMKLTARMDELDDMVTTTFHSFQALTVNCARCHDHKFDPIPARDYYKLTAVFGGVGFGTREVASADQRAERDRLAAPLRKDLQQVRQELGAIENPPRTKLLLERYQTLDRERAREPRRLPLNPIWNRTVFAPVTAARFRLAITSHRGKAAKIDKLQLLPAGHTVTAWTAAVEATPDKPVYLEISLDRPREISALEWSTDRESGVTDGTIQVYRLEYSLDGQAWLPACDSMSHVGRNELDLPEVGDAEWLPALAPPARAERDRLLARRSEIEARIKALPEVPLLYAAKPREMARSFLLDRGSVSKPGVEVFPGALTAIPQLPADFRLPADSSEGARRLALADWIASPNNPLTARVIVNRVWYYHFGAGLVNTPSDFGVMGDRPSHPELLDYLAVSFMENGWSIKWLHRLILSSRTYQQSSAHNQKAHAIDAGNRLLWRMPLRRMDAETLRDSMLHITGNLNPKRGGPSFMLQKKGDKGSYIYAALDNDGPDVWRRAVYRFVVRGGERIMLDSFDCPDPSVATPQRNASNTALQALALMNNSFVLRQSDLLARRIEREAGASAADRITRAYNLVFGRPPMASEVSLGEQFLARNPLAAYCRVLFNANEFVYVP